MSETPPVYTLAYFSCTKRRWDDADLFSLLEQSRKKNARLDVTGFLIYAEGSFFQWLEGPNDRLEALYDEIRADPRHELVTQILHESLSGREFGSWSMAFVPNALDDETVRNDFVHLKRIFEGREFLAEAPPLARRIAATFLNNNWV
jgi:hypothetical protein